MNLDMDKGTKKGVLSHILSLSEKENKNLWQYMIKRMN